MKVSYERVIQRVADKLEVQNLEFYGLGNLSISQVLQAVESLEDDGLTLDYIIGREELIAQKIRSAATVE